MFRALMQAALLAVAWAAAATAAPSAASDGIAVLISNQAYRSLPEAPYAHRNAAAVRDYLIRERGFAADRIIELRDAAGAEIASLLGGAEEERSRLAGLLRPGDADLFVYYAGHGAASAEGRPRLLPVDAAADGGYALEGLLRRLAALPARRVTVVLETALAAGNDKGRRTAAGGWLGTTALAGHVTLLAAAAPGQTAGAHESVGGGLFTRCLLPALSGEADARGDRNGLTTVGEVRAYLARALPETAMRLLRRPQHAVVIGDADWVLVGTDPAPIAKADGRAVAVTAASLRSAPTTRSERLDVLEAGALLQLVGEARDRRWLQVRRGDVTGFVFAPLVRLETGAVEAVPAVAATAGPPAEPQSGTFLVLDETPLRVGPGMTDAVLETLRAGTRVQAIAAVDGGRQLQVRLADGKVGFLARESAHPAGKPEQDLDAALAALRAGLERDGPATAARAAAMLNTALLSEIHERISSDYVEPIASSRLLDGLAAGVYRAARDAGDEAEAESLSRAAIEGMIAALDRHSGYLDAKQYSDMQVQVRGEFAGLGIEVTMENDRVKVVSPIDNTPAARAGLKAGDLISHLDGEPVEGMSLSEAVSRMRGRIGTSIRLTVEREGRPPFDVTIVRDVVRIQAVRWQVHDDVGYVRITTFSENAESALRQALNEIRAALGDRYRGLILDLRNNPGGLLKQAVAVSDIFLDKGEIVSLRGRTEGDVWRYRATRGDAADGHPMLVLINGGSASASEIVASALQDQRRAVVAGASSFGKGSVQTIVPLRNRGALRLTTARYFRPSGIDIEGEGVRPDVELETEGLELPEVIERARRLLLVQSAAPAGGSARQ